MWARSPLTSKLDHALALAAKGFRVFPLIPNGKTPAIKQWPDKATTDEAQIRRWWPNGSERNIGVATGQGLVVLDVDVKNGAKGAESYAALDLVHEFPETYTVTTPTGGKHAYFRSDADVRNSASKIGAGIDIRGTGGFVVGPGSSLGEASYCACSDTVPVHELPASVATMAGLSSRADGAGDRQTSPSKVELDTPQAQSRAADYLLNAEPAIEGAGGDHHTFKVICAVKDLGITPETALDLLCSLWNDRCSPPWQPEDLQAKIHNAYEYGERPIGIKDPANDFEPVQLDSLSEGAPNARLPIKYAADIVPSADFPFLVDGYLAQRSLSVMYGKSGAGKSFVALDLSFCVATGKAWFGHETSPGAVLYVAAEGGAGIDKRISAMKKHFGVSDFPLAVIPAPLTLTRKEDVKQLLAAIDEAALHLAKPVVLVIFDTLNNVMEGDENASADMRALVKAAKAVISSTGAHVMLIHHSGKDVSKGERGHSSLRAAVDTALEVVDNVLHTNKQRDTDELPPQGFRRVNVDLGKTSRGKDIVSCVVEWAAPGEEFIEVALTRSERDAYEAVKAAMAAGGSTTADVMTAYRSLGGTASESTLKRELRGLESKGAAFREGSARHPKWVAREI